MHNAYASDSNVLILSKLVKINRKKIIAHAQIQT